MTTSRAPEPEPVIETAVSGDELFSNPLLNKGTAFTEAERDEFELHGLLPPNVGTLEEQISRRVQALRSFQTDLERYAFLRELQDTNETLFYALLVQNLEEFLPIVYTPTVGAGCQMFSRLYRKPRGIFLSYPHRNRIAQIIAHRRFDRVEAIVVTDGERVLGLGDLGAGGMGIPIGKLALYTACGGLHPATTLPIFLDVGTDNAERLADPLYVGWRHERVRGAEYDEFIETFIAAVVARWPRVLVQWEDFARANATRLLERYRDRLCTFNDDIQGTAAVATGALLAAINVTGVALEDQRIAILGAGSAGCGIAGLMLRMLAEAGLDPRAAARRFYMIDRDGLLVDGMNDVLEFQLPFLQPRETVAPWRLDHPDKVVLLDVVRNARPTVLIGVSGQPGAFSKTVIAAMAEHTARPVIFPLSNPTSRAEASPEDLTAWTGGRAVIGTGSPFPPVERNGARVKFDQTNNSYIFPGVGLGCVAVGARRVSDRMLMAAAKALGAAQPARTASEAHLLPPVTALREVAVTVARAVAHAARAEGLAGGIAPAEIDGAIAAKIWTPRYLPYRRILRPGA